MTRNNILYSTACRKTQTPLAPLQSLKGMVANSMEDDDIANVINKHNGVVPETQFKITGSVLNAASRLANLWSSHIDDTTKPSGVSSVIEFQDGHILTETTTISSQEINDEPEEEYKHKQRIAILMNCKGEFEKAAILEEDGTLNPFVVDTKNTEHSVAMIFSMMTYATMGESYFEKYGTNEDQIHLSEILAKTLMHDVFGGYKSTTQIAKFCHSFDFMFKNDSDVLKVYSGSPLNLNCIQNCSIPTIELLEISALDYDKDHVAGYSRIFSADDPINTRHATKAVKATTSVSDIASLAGKYSPNPEYDGSQWGSDWKSLIPSDEALAGYTVTQDIIEICEDIQDDCDARNFLLRGVPGTGKTEACKIVSKLCQLPYAFFSCGDGMTDLDLKLQVIPNGDEVEVKSISLEDFMKNMPSLMDRAINPAESFKKITGVEKLDATSEDCESAMMKEYARLANRQANNFKYVYSNIIKGFKYGGVVEIQELQLLPSSTAAAMNSMLDSCKSVTLMNGETIHRHPECVFIFTTNTGLYGLNHTNQSFISRCVVRDIELPDNKELTNRLMKASGLKDRAVAQKMIKVMLNCQEAAEREGIVDGAIDFRALKMWAREVAIHPKRGIYNTFLKTFVTKCTENVEDQKMFFVPCIDKEFKISE